MAESAAHVRVIEETPAYWRVVFDYPPFNIVDATIFEGLQDLLARMDSSPSLRVVVFESANPDFYLAHFDLTPVWKSWVGFRVACQSSRNSGQWRVKKRGADTLTSAPPETFSYAILF